LEDNFTGARKKSLTPINASGHGRDRFSIFLKNIKEVKIKESENKDSEQSRAPQKQANHPFPRKLPDRVPFFRRSKRVSGFWVKV